MLIHHQAFSLIKTLLAHNSFQSISLETWLGEGDNSLFFEELIKSPGQLTQKLFTDDDIRPHLETSPRAMAILNGNEKLASWAAAYAPTILRDPRDDYRTLLIPFAERGSSQGSAGLMMVLGGATGPDTIKTFSSTDLYSFAFPGSKGAQPAQLDARKRGGCAVGTTSFLLFFGGVQIDPAVHYDSVERYLWATPSTKGTSPISLNEICYDAAVGGNTEVAFILGGRNASDTYLTVGEQYVYASLGTRGTAPTSLNSTRDGAGSGSNPSYMFILGGWATTAAISTGETYVFATGGSNGTTPANLSSSRDSLAGAANSTQCFMFGGSGGYYAEQYLFATPGTKGSAPAALSRIAIYPAAAANTTQAFLCPGASVWDSSKPSSDVLEQYLFTTPATKGVTPAKLCQPRWQAGASSNAHGGLQ